MTGSPFNTNREGGGVYPRRWGLGALRGWEGVCGKRGGGKKDLAVNLA